MRIAQKYSLFFVLVCLVFSPEKTISQGTKTDQGVHTLMDRLDTTLLSSIVTNPNELATCAQELLDFYQHRKTITHPASKKVEEETITARDLQYANDALKHIFVGQPAYPAHFCGEDINWNSRPVPDMEWIWQLHRMYFWDAMAKVYTATGDERYAKEWCTQMVDWVNKNPRDPEHEYAWRSIEAGIRGHKWTGQFVRFLQSEHVTPEVLVAFMNSCYDHAEFLMTKYSTGSNWALMEAEGLAFIAFTFPEFKKSETWKTEALRRLSLEIEKQVYADGHQKELAMGYHIGSINWFYRTYELATLNGDKDAFSHSFSSIMERMCEVPMKLCLPDGTNAQFGDSWAGSPGQYAHYFSTWAELFQRDDFLFMATEGEQGQAPDQTAFALAESGIYSLRSGWDTDAICMVLKCGPDGGYHCQPDNGTFTLYAGGRTLMPDAGSYIYSGDPEGRNWFRQTQVHQTLTLNGENSQFAPKLLKWETGKDLDVLVVENESYDHLKHRRYVFLVDKTYFLIVDEAIGRAVGDVDIHFQLAPCSTIVNTEHFAFHSDYQDGWNVLVQSMNQKGLELSEEEGKVSYEYTKQEARPAFRYRLEKTGEDQTIQFITLVAPYEGEVPDATCEVLNRRSQHEDGLQIRVKVDGIERVLTCAL